MSKDLNPEKALIFRIMHKDNLARVLANGCQSRTAVMGQAGYVEIGNQELIQKRTARAVPCPPGGTLSDYVPFYFTPYTPMMYNIKTGRGVPKQPLSDIYILVSSLHKLRAMKIDFVFSDRHAYLKTALFSNNLNDLDRIIWPTLQERDFKKDDADKFEKYQAEALVHNYLPVNGLLGIACRTDKENTFIQDQTKRHGVEVKVSTLPGWYL